MKRILIAGNSPAAASFIEELRQRDQDSEVTLFSMEDRLPCQRHLFGDFLAQNVTEDELMCRDNEFYARHQVNVITGKKAVRFDFKKNRLVGENREYFGYDILVIVDAPSFRFPDIRGTNKDGVFNFRRWHDIRRIAGQAPLIDTASVQSAGLSGLKAAYGLRKRDKEVFLVVPGPTILTHLIDAQCARVIEGYLEGRGIQIIRQNSLNQIMGDGDVKAIRLASGKVMASQMVLFTDILPDLRVFSDTPLELSQGIVVNEDCRSHIDNVYALDWVCQKHFPKAVDDYELSALWLDPAGRRLAGFLSGQDEKEAGCLRDLPLTLFDMKIRIMGDVMLAKADVFENGDRRALCKLYFSAGCLRGAVLINCAFCPDPLKEMIERGRTTMAEARTFIERTAGGDLCSNAASAVLGLERTDIYPVSGGWETAFSRDDGMPSGDDMT